MKAKPILTVLVLFALALALTASSGLAQERPSSREGSVRVPPPLPVGSAFTYQGQLKKDGKPYNGSCDFVFRLYDAPEGDDTLVGTVYRDNVAVSNGLFTVLLDFGQVFWAPDSYANNWLEISVRCPAGSGQYTDLAPRQQLTPVPYALALPGLRTQQNNASPNIIGGYNGNQVIGGVIGATISGGGSWRISSHPNRITDNFGTIGGGEDNRAGNDNDTTNDAAYATVGGGYGNIASGSYATVGGGYTNIVSGTYATVGGGYYNTASGASATVGGGADNTASSDYAAVGGGYYNTASGLYATVGGGYDNMADGDTGATVGGGVSNAASGLYATVGGGHSNTVNGNVCATVGGGFYNTASGDYATVPGGYSAVASHYGEMAYASGYFTARGDAQTSLYVMRIEKTCTTGVWYDLYLNGNAGGPSGYLTVAPGRAMAFDALIVGRTEAGESAGYLIRGVIENVGGTTAFVGSPTVTTLGEDDAAWNVQAVASNTFDALFIQVQGNGETIRWVATVRTAEVNW